MLLTHVAWQEAGRKRYGANTSTWRFACPSCGFVATPADWREAGAPEGAIAFSCVGRWLGPSTDAFQIGAESPKGPCNYAGGGLFRINPIGVMDPDLGASQIHQIFDFADEPLLSTYSAAEREKA